MNELEELIQEEIRREGLVTFARFMEVALYHPALGYYAGGGVGREPLGWEGDYFTSGDVHPLWGWSVARQLHQMWELMGRPARFDVMEPGGRGLLANRFSTACSALASNRRGRRPWGALANPARPRSCQAAIQL